MMIEQQKLADKAAQADANEHIKDDGTFNN